MSVANCSGNTKEHPGNLNLIVDRFLFAAICPKFDVETNNGCSFGASQEIGHRSLLTVWLRRASNCRVSLKLSEVIVCTTTGRIANILDARDGLCWKKQACLTTTTMEFETQVV